MKGINMHFLRELKKHIFTNILMWVADVVFVTTATTRNTLLIINPPKHNLSTRLNELI